MRAYQFTFLTDAQTGSSNNWEAFMAQITPTLLEIQLGAQAELASREAELGLLSAPSLDVWGQRYLGGSLTNPTDYESILEDAADHRQSLLTVHVQDLVDQDIRWMQSLLETSWRIMESLHIL
jgi:hypothetical protein